MADEEGLRRQAVRRHLAGEPAADVAEDLGRSKRWVHKWTRRFREEDEGWFQARSRAPKTTPSATPDRIVELVVAARRKLESDPRAQRGAPAVAWKLKTMGVAEAAIPHSRTIERIIADAGLAKPARPAGDGYESKGVAYPLPAADAPPGELHEADPVGPRWLDGGEQVYSFHVMDVGSHRVGLEPLSRPKPLWLAQRLVAAWQRLGIPTVVQFDNQSTLRGAINNPRRFGPVPATALALGATVRYVPLSEPWRQGAIEHFQDVFDKSLFRVERFTDLEHLRERAHVFEDFHNRRHHYSTLDGATPNQTWAAAGRQPDRPPEGFQVPDQLPDHGRIEAIRFIRSDGTLDLFGEPITLPDQATYSYVVAAIDLHDQLLSVVDVHGELLLRRVHTLH